MPTLMHIEAALWCVVLVALPSQLAALVRRAKQEGQTRALLAIVAVAMALRLIVPFGPVNWYLGVSNVEGLAAFSRSTTYVPLPLRELTFHLAQGSSGARLFNLLTGVLCVPVFWYVACLAGCSRRASMIFAALIGCIPMYVRYSASDGSQTTIVLLYAVAAVAFLRVVHGEHTALDHLMLGAAITLGFPIRLESGVLFLSIPFFAFHGEVKLRGLRAHAALAGVFLVACALGAAWMWQFHAPSMRDHASLQPASALIAFVGRTLFIVNPGGVFFFPPILAVPIWFHVVALIKQRAWKELSALYIPIYFCGIPSAFADGPFISLPSAGYHVVSVLFVVLAAARALDRVWERVADSGRIKAWRRATAVLIAAPCAHVFFVGPYLYTYAYQEEYQFLMHVLPKQDVTVLTIWDPDTGASDLDCCLALPYPTFLPDRRAIHWVVLDRGDLKSDRLGDVRFDYYYPGSMAALDPDSLESWYGRLVAPNPERRAKLRAHVEEIQQLDALVRQTWHVVPDGTVTVPARTFSSVGFRNDRADLTFYRRVEPPEVTAVHPGAPPDSRPTTPTQHAEPAR